MNTAVIHERLDLRTDRTPLLQELPDNGIAGTELQQNGTVGRLAVRGGIERQILTST